MKLVVAVCAALATTAACSYDGQGEDSIDPGDPAVFGAHVQPVMGPACGTLDCHGEVGQPLALFAKNGLRADASLRGEELSTEELTANVLSIAAVDPTSPPPESLVILKPLAESAGGMHHIGEDIWSTLEDPDAACVLAWLERRAEDELDAACPDVLPAR